MCIRDRIDTPYGSENIENISIGDSVYAKNPDTGEIGVKTVSYTHLDVYKRQFMPSLHEIVRIKRNIDTK